MKRLGALHIQPFLNFRLMGVVSFGVSPDFYVMYISEKLKSPDF